MFLKPLIFFLHKLSIFLGCRALVVSPSPRQPDELHPIAYTSSSVVTIMTSLPIFPKLR